MRFSLYLFLFSALLTHLHAAEYGSLYHQNGEYETFVSDVITLNEGDVFEVIGASWSEIGFRLVARDQRHRVQDSWHSNNESLIGTKIVGPCLVGIMKMSSSPNGGEHLRISYKLTRSPDPQAVSTPTAN
jgi:hypothetical protein